MIVCLLAVLILPFLFFFFSAFGGQRRATQSLRLKKKKSATSQHANIAALLDEASISVADRELVSAAAQRISSAVSSMTIANVGPLIQSLPEL